MKALVTGGGGFLGRYIVEQLLERGDEVVVAARGNYPELVAMGVELVRGDLADAATAQKACDGVDIVFHVAAKAGLWGAWDDFYRPNVVATKNLLEACKTKGIGKFVFTSSPSVIFDNQPHTGCDESHPYPEHYESFYPQTKAMAEQLVMKANCDALLTVSLRPHLIWGPRDAHILPGIIARAKEGKLIQVGDGTNEVDMVYVEDAARAHLQSADALMPGSPLAGSAYFITQDEPVNLWGWIAALLTHLGLQPPQRNISLGTARAIGALMECAYRWLHLQGEPRMTKFLASELAMSHYYDISRAKKDFDYQPQFTMDTALEKTLPWLQENLPHH